MTEPDAFGYRWGVDGVRPYSIQVGEAKDGDTLEPLVSIQIRFQEGQEPPTILFVPPDTADAFADELRHWALIARSKQL